MQPSTILHRAIRRLQLTTKQVNGGYYKGTRSGAMGRHTKHGQYIIEWDKVRTYVVPDLKGFELMPFVTKKMEPTRGEFPGSSPLDGKAYLENWKMVNGED
ncbi:hypothetical protein L873DRAFT_1837101 [Choiromyces venosus 120613-1]|uniref:50S ribosomal protein YmL27 n=1 Tax=Choiromyces venosus 120613-1 TaxID=1336337 RepID=A0A3N4JBA5_9PEZI|nr:hypothetical protein L873DRAFT_1837101 [Choiromyces venosus 120613-1]